MSDLLNTGEILFYQTDDAQSRVEVRCFKETVWLSLNQMAALFQRDKSVISKHIKNIFEENELTPEATVANFATVQTEGKRAVARNIEFYDLNVIISVGYRVKSTRGTQFRIWATRRLKEYLIKGFAIDDERLKNSNASYYFDELLERIRDIRSSEKMFWKKVLEIYSTSMDYSKDAELTKQFFRVIQNKMHWAAHGQTAAEVISTRANAKKINMGMTSWTAGKRYPSKSDSVIAKNYLTHEEMDVLNRIVTMYLDFAELQALNRRPMAMQDWVNKLDDFLKISEREILTTAGTISHEKALDKAYAEYEKYHAKIINDISPVEEHFVEAINTAKRVEKLVRKKTSKAD